VNNVLLQPVYIEMRAEFMRALAPYAEAKLAVAQALRQIESKAATEVRPTGFAS
jgi:hypothetical protein